MRFRVGPKSGVGNEIAEANLPPFAGAPKKFLGVIPGVEGHAATSRLEFGCPIKTTEK